MITSWLKQVLLNKWPGGSQLIRTTPSMPQNMMSMAFSELGSNWDCFFRSNSYSTWVCINEDRIPIPSDDIAETNVRLYLSDLEKRFCAVDSFPPKLLREHVWDLFKITILKINKFGHMLPNHNIWNVQIFTQRPQWRERSFKQSFQDCNISII
jgi:hypothetical protein